MDPVTSDVQQMGGDSMRVTVRSEPTGADAPPPAATPARPEWLPEKFKAPEDMAKAYSELEKQFSQRGQPTTTETPKAPATETPTVPAVEPPKIETPDPAAAAAEAATKAAGIDMAGLRDEFSKTGQLSPETYTRLEQSGFAKADVDGYIAGQQALAAQITSGVHEAAGGAEQYNAMVTWAQANMSAGEIAAYNDAMHKGADAAKAAAAGLSARHQLAMGSDPKLIGGGAAAGDVYESRAQVTADIKNPLYQRDPAFRTKVEAKIARSTVF